MQFDNDEHVTNSKGIKIRKLQLTFVLSNENFYPFLRPKVKPNMTNSETSYYNQEK